MIIDSKKEVIELKNLSDLSALETHSSMDDIAVILCSIVTTSLSPTAGDILRINLKLCHINKDGNFTKHRNVASFFEDPKRELSNEESQFLDFSISDKNGSNINWELISGLLQKAELVIAHNAAFVKPWIEKYTGNMDVLWGCSMDQVNWAEMGFPSRSLNVLSVFSGFFYDFKNSASTLDALTHVLSLNNSTKNLIIKAKSPDLQIFAANAPRELNHLLKERRYRWNPDVGSWWLGLENTEQGELESKWLSNNLPGTEPQIFEIDPKFRFSR